MELEDVAESSTGCRPRSSSRCARTVGRGPGGRDRALAKDIGTLPKPSAAASACNLLVRAHRAEIEELVELGNLLREAQQNLAGAELKALDVQRAGWSRR